MTVRLTQTHPQVCTEVWWGKRLSAVRVNLPAANSELLSELLQDAWEGKAPPRVIRAAGREP